MAFNYNEVTINNPIASGTTNYEVLTPEKRSNGLLFNADCISKDLNSYYNNISNAIKYNQEHGSLWIQNKEYMKNSIVSIYIKVGNDYVKQNYRSLIDNNKQAPIQAKNYTITGSGFSYFEGMQLVNDEYWLSISNSDTINIQQDFNHYITNINTSDTADNQILVYKLLDLSTFTNSSINSKFSIDIIRVLQDKEYLVSCDVSVIGYNDNIDINISNSIYDNNHYIDITNNTIYYSSSKYRNIAYNGCFLSYDKSTKSIMLNILPVSVEERSYFIISYNNTKIKPSIIPYTRSYSFYNNLSNKLYPLKNTESNIGDLIYKHYNVNNFDLFINGYIKLDIEKTFDSFLYQRLYAVFNNNNTLYDIVNKYMIDRTNTSRYLVSELLPYTLSIEHNNNNSTTNTNLDALFFCAFGGPSRSFLDFSCADANTNNNGNWIYTSNIQWERRNNAPTRIYGYNLNMWLTSNNSNIKYDINRPESIFINMYIKGF